MNHVSPLVRFAVMAARAGAVSFAVLFSGVAQANILSNGGFETPVVGGNFDMYVTGVSVGTGGAWQVVGDDGATGNVALVNGATSYAGFSLFPRSGGQWLDLTGDGSNNAVGVEQSFPTTINGNYRLSFFIGNVVHAGGDLGTSSSVRVYIDGTLVDTFTNGLGTGNSLVNWLEFHVPFTATQGTTTVRFVNDDSATDNLNGLDNVAVIRTDVPAGGGGGALHEFFLGALLVAGLLRRRRMT